MDRILELSVSEPRALVFALANAHWLWKQEFTCSFAENLRDHKDKARSESRTGFKNALHRVDAILTVMCKGTRSDTIWMECTTCAKQFILLFRARLAWENTTVEPTALRSAKIHLVGKLRENMSLACKLLNDGDSGLGEVYTRT